MNISFMRTVDRWVGIPLCLLLSATRALTRGFRKFAPADPPRRILFMEISEMGSMVLAYPLFNKTRVLFPEAELFFLTFQQNRHAIDMLSISRRKTSTLWTMKNPCNFFLRF